MYTMLSFIFMGIVLMGLGLAIRRRRDIKSWLENADDSQHNRKRKARYHIRLIEDSLDELEDMGEIPGDVLIRVRACVKEVDDAQTTQD